MLRRLWMAALLMAIASVAQALTVSAAASLGEALREIGARFQAQGGPAVHFNFAASGVLLQQLRQGAPVDVLASADEATAQRGVALGLLEPASRRVFARNALVLVAPIGSALPQTLADLARPELRRIALGKPANVPAGRYAEQALQQHGLAAAVAAKRVPADNVRQVLDYVARGEVDAGLVYASDVRAAATRVRKVQRVTGTDPIVYPALRVKGGQADAQAFIDFLLSPEAQAILARHGFEAP
jgi:molybdate transport system substrate-binding protein